MSVRVGIPPMDRLPRQAGCGTIVRGASGDKSNMVARSIYLALYTASDRRTSLPYCRFLYRLRINRCGHYVRNVSRPKAGRPPRDRRSEEGGGVLGVTCICDRVQNVCGRVYM